MFFLTSGNLRIWSSSCWRVTEHEIQGSESTCQFSILNQPVKKKLSGKEELKPWRICLGQGCTPRPPCHALAAPDCPGCPGLPMAPKIFKTALPRPKNAPSLTVAPPRPEDFTTAPACPTPKKFPSAPPCPEAKKRCPVHPWFKHYKCAFKIHSGIYWILTGQTHYHQLPKASNND